MIVRTSLGFTLKVNEDGRFHLPDREFTTTELKKVAREVNRHLRENDVKDIVNEVFYDE